MAIISNSPILQNPLSKKAFSKISFEAGEKFNARIVSVDQQNGEVNLKLLDGWQFSAKLDKPLEQGTSGSVLNFEVEGFEDGKLEIKLVSEDNKSAENDILKDTPSGQSLSTDKTDALLFEKMIKHDMPLTKENIVDIKNLLDFKGKISSNEEKEDVFITKYIESRDIDPSSDKGIEITNVLKNFFTGLKNLNVDEILLFKENDIGVTKENLESFVKLFKGDSAIYNNIKEISNYLLNSEENTGMEASNNTILNKSNDNNFEELVSIINKELKNLGIDHVVTSSTIEKLVPNKNIEPGENSKLQNVSFSKGEIKTLVNKILKTDNITIDSDSNIKLIKNIKEDLNAKEIIIDSKLDNNIKNINSNDIISNKGQMVDKDQNLNSTVNNKVNDGNNKINDGINSKEIVSLINKELKNLGINHVILDSSNENLEQTENLKQVQNLESGKSLDQSKDPESNENLNSQNNSNNKVDIKTFVDESLKSENISISSESRTKLINNIEEKLNGLGIESVSKNSDNVKQSENIPLDKLDKVTVNESNVDNKSSIDTKVNGYSKNNSLNEIISMIKKELNFSEVDKKVIDNVEKEITKITTDNLIKDQIKLKTGEIKDIVKDIISKLDIKPETYDKVMDVFTQKLNDVKLFNSISQQYYCLDLPINVKNNEYQLKLIIKDDRRKGKKIDSKNVKIATSIKTINMGTVDAYIKVNNSSMNIDINCNETFVKVLDIGKDKLVKDLSSLNYRVSINVNNKVKEFTLVECGEFFNDRSFNAINIKV